MAQTISCHFLLPTEWVARTICSVLHPHAPASSSPSVYEEDPSLPSLDPLFPTAMKRFVLPQVRFCCMRLCRVQGRLSWAVQIISCATLVACVCLCLRGLRFYHLFNLHLSWMFAGEFPPRLKRVIIISLPWHTADVPGLTQWHKSCSNVGRWRFDWWDGLVYMLQSVCKKMSHSTVRFHWLKVLDLNYNLNCFGLWKFTESYSDFTKFPYKIVENWPIMTSGSVDPTPYFILLHRVRLRSSEF